ncbi:glycosyltransferase [Desulfocurvibacter africanus]|uniref:Glycosyl transferase group 1 n=1 Tax=Desulfocurvibacter africanus subsp. africanus str. Walvis Bay TaxID=690850 RepID=F3YUN1_DESAF|nr:glycosyltransferase [Desulfocurvibacter africanus]EGJ48985.1 glycosyl transferase group 1 [Desulfocurvibacter africanus subsp. africanus str. Walvis Bay]
MKIDLHVHCKYSTKPSQWILKKLGCPESFTQPEKLYRIAKARGMDLVTISDHNTIDGALEIAHLPDTFISEEITAYFPEDRCKVHVLALDIDEAIHREVYKLRENIFELVPYLRQKGITHVCAHPLYGVNDRLTVEHFEQLLLLFKSFECNGTRDGYQNDVLRAILAGLTPQVMDELAERHGMEPGFDEPWKKGLTGGSDDHSALNIASLYTVVDGAMSLEEYKQGLHECRSRPEGRCSNPQAMALNLYSIAYQFYKNRFKLERYVNKDIFLRFADRFLGAEEAPRESGVMDRLQAYFTTRKYLRGKSHTGPVQDVVRFEAARLVCDDPDLLAVAKGQALPEGEAEREWFRFTTRASSRVLTIFADNLLGHASGANIFDVFQTVGSAGALYTVLAPYFVAYGLFKKDRAFCDKVAARFAGKPAQQEAKVGHFTDTFFEVNGVAKTLQRSVNLAVKTGRDLTIVTCHPQAPKGEGVVNFEPVGVYDLPEYPELKVFYPPVLEMLHHAYEQGFTHIHSATPGPIGLTALLIARILKLPLYGTYHTQIPQYVGKLTEDNSMEELSWKYILWYYNQCDLVFAPSQSTADELIAKGLPADKIRVYPRGVDVERFHPAKRNGFLKRYDIKQGGTLLYVGRISKEKNLDLLAEAFERLHRSRPESNLVLAGDGPYKEELRERLRGLPCVFTGYLEGEDLAALYASCDLFVFPSRTDTFGNVVLEAQASGLPVIVTNEGGPQENVLKGQTGMVVGAVNPEELCRAMESLLADPSQRRSMGQCARTYMEERSFEQAFYATWDMLYRDAAASRQVA